MSVRTYRKTVDVPHTAVVPIPSAKPHEHFCENSRNKLVFVAIGALIGFILCMTYVLWLVISKLITSDVHTQVEFVHVKNDSIAAIPGVYEGVLKDAPLLREPDVDRDSLYVGVFTLSPYLDTRAKACEFTWGQSQHIDKLEYYAETQSPHSHSHLPLVPIEGRRTEDAWHAEKSLLMLEHICERHVDEFDWFLRAVDDAYIDAERLRELLDKLEKNREIMLGHPTSPIDDTSFKALSGREYCFGGPGMLFSRPLMQRMCPHLASCRERFSMLPADVAIAKCVSETTGVECAFHTKLHEYFVHSFEKNQFHLLDEFEQQMSTAVTYHPLKQPWMMTTLHHRLNIRRLEHALKELEQLKISREAIANKVKRTEDAEDKHGQTQSVATDVTLLSRNGTAFPSDPCQRNFHLTENEMESLDQAVRLANTSMNWGHSQRCPSLLSAYHVQLQEDRLHIIDMACHNRVNNHPTLARTVLSRPVLDIFVNKERSWKTSRYLVVIVKAELQDPNLPYFMLQLRNAVLELDRTVILNILHTHRKSKTLDGSWSLSSDELLERDLETWASHYNVVLKTHRIQNPGQHTNRALRDITFILSHEYRDATVLFTSIKAKIGVQFLQRCVTMVKRGSYAYRPHLIKHTAFVGTTQVFQQSEDILYNNEYRPLCMDIKDIVSIAIDRSKRQSKHSNSDPLIYVNTAADPDFKLMI